MHLTSIGAFLLASVTALPRLDSAVQHQVPAPSPDIQHVDLLIRPNSMVARQDCGAVNCETLAVRHSGQASA